MATTQETTKPTSTQEDYLRRARIDSSVRTVVLFFFFSAAHWLIAASVLGIIASVKLYAPGFLDFSWTYWLHYGRVQPAFWSAFLYGWAIQAGFGVSIWIMARLCRTELSRSWIVVVAGLFWNIGVTIGVLGILFGGSTSMEWLEFPPFVWPLLFVAYCLIAVWMVVMFATRRNEEVFISQWYILGACFWFPWIYLTTNLFLHVFPGNGVMAAAINAWYTNTLIFLYFVPVGLASAYYFIPKIVGRPIHSYQLALVGFWGLALLAGWTGMQKFMGGPLPAWMPAVGGTAIILMVVPAIAVALNHHLTTRGHHGLVNFSPTLRFTVFGAVTYTAMSGVAVLVSTLWFAEITQFTLAIEGFKMMAVYAFFSMAMFGAIYYIVPRLTGCEWLSGRFIRMHFWFSTYGIATMVAVLLLGGFAQGSSLNRPENWALPVVGAVVNSHGYLIGRTIAWTFILFSNVVFLFHLGLMVLRLGRRSAEPTLMHRMDDHHAPSPAAATNTTAEPATAAS